MQGRLPAGGNLGEPEAPAGRGRRQRPRPPPQGADSGTVSVEPTSQHKSGPLTSAHSAKLSDDPEGRLTRNFVHASVDCHAQQICQSQENAHICTGDAAADADARASFQTPKPKSYYPCSCSLSVLFLPMLTGDAAADVPHGRAARHREADPRLLLGPPQCAHQSINIRLLHSISSTGFLGISYGSKTPSVRTSVLMCFFLRPLLHQLAAFLNAPLCDSFLPL